MTLLIAVNGVRIQVVNTLEKLTHANRPVNWRCLDLQHFLDFIEQLNGIANIAVQFIYKAYDRGITQSTDIHQLNGSVLYPFCTIDNHQGGIHRSQRAVGVLRKVFVTRRIQEVDHAIVIGKLHDRGRD